MKKKTIISSIILMGIILFSVEIKAEDRINAYNNYSFNETNNISLRMDFASAEEVAVVETWDISATSADHVTATLYNDGKLVISGTGEMKNYANNQTNPHTWYIYRNDIKKVIIEKGLTNIGVLAFYGCENLISIDIPDSVTSIGECAFYECSSLTSIDIPDGVTTIGHSAFRYCSNLKSVKLPEGLTKIEDWMFDWCRNLISINIPEGITSIGYYAFSSCESLTSIEIPEGVITIGYCAFTSCDSLTNIKIPEGITSIEDNTFRGCDNLINIQIPESVINIGKSAFYGCRSLTSIEIPEGVTSIGEAAFWICSSLTSINIPKGVTNIGDGAFYWCNSLTSIEIPEGVTSIGDRAFYWCSSLTSINIPKGVTSIGKDAFYGCHYTHTIAVEENAGNEITVSVPNIVQRTFSEEDIMYANETAPTLNKCTISEDKQKLTFKKEDVMKNNVKIEIKDGALRGLVVVVVPSGTIFYDKTSWINQDVTATIYIAEGEKITNNNESNNYKFTENGEFTFTYTDIEGNNKTSTAKVDWIDKQAPTITNVTGNPTNWTDEDVTLTVNAQDSLSGIKEYSFDGGTTWQTENNKTYNDNENGISIKIKDNVGNIATYTQTIDITKIRCKNGHNFGEWIIDKEPTYKEEGHKYRKCIRCDNKEELSIPKLTEEETQITTTYKVKEIDGQKYIILQPKTKVEEVLKNITSNKEIEIVGKDNKKLEDNSMLLTGAEVRISGEDKVQYIIAVKGDINGDGQIEFINDIVLLNNYRLNRIKLSTESILAGDVNEDGKTDFINDIVKINNYRLNRINSL